jgi:hypothetical protein
LRGRKKKTIILASGVALGAVFISAIVTYSISKVSINNQRVQYEQLLAQKVELIKQYEQKSIVGLVLTSDKSAGDTLQEGDLEPMYLPDYFTPANVVRDASMAVGKVLKIRASKGTAITSEMVYASEKADASRRIEESQYIRLPLRVSPRDIVDVRVVFPTGEDYVVLSKKQLNDVDVEHQIAFFEVNEDELHLLRSALVDAYRRNAEIYAIQYTEPHLQEKAAVTYTPQIEVLEVMISSPNVIDKARWALAEGVRKAINERFQSGLEKERPRLTGAPPPGGSISLRGELPVGIQGASADTPNQGQPGTQTAPAAQVQTQAAGVTTPVSSENSGLLGGG